MKSFAAAVAFGVAVISCLVARAQEDPAESTETASGPAIPPVSDAPVVDMQRFCGLRPPQRFYPQRAMERRIGGRVVLDCLLREDGTARTCQVVDENPPRMEFGRASLTLACQFHASATSTPSDAVQLYERDGERRVRYMVNWRLGH